jgi:RNA polymerase sigma-70 factor (ECF subfamily)
MASNGRATSEPLTQSNLDRNDDALLDALKHGDERVFTELVERWSGMMLRVARSHLGDHAVAEDVVQDAWLTVLRSLDRFERRSTLRTWVLGIVVNLARSRARAERRTVGVPSDPDGPAVDSTRFLPANHPRWPHHWALEPSPWRTPEDDLLAGETRRVVFAAIQSLPVTQREVLVLRDLQGLAATDVCNILGLTDTHQRVLLHRARSRVRLALERYLAAPEAT